MILPNFTKKEIVSQLNRDSTDLRLEFSKIAADNRYKRWLMKNGKKDDNYFFKEKNLSLNGNNYIILPMSKGYNDYKKKGLIGTVGLVYRSKNGFEVCMPVEGSYVFFTSHYFDRYRERQLKNTQVSKLDTIAKALRYNSTSCCKDNPSEKYPNSIFATSEEGVSLGIIDNDGFVVYKTYLPFEMLKTNQTDDKAKLMGVLQEAIKNK